jgi:hypothetical protein
MQITEQYDRTAVCMHKHPLLSTEAPAFHPKTSANCVWLYFCFSLGWTLYISFEISIMSFDTSLL